VTTALLGIGSNIEPEKHLQAIAQVLRQKFVNIHFSHVYQSAAVGMDGDDFLNACCLMKGVPAQDELLQFLKALEDDYKRDRSKGSWKPRTLDLDLLIYDEVVLDQDLYHYAHVFVPASDLISMNLPNDDKGLVKKLGLRL